jgi:4-hydroxy-4-methyl-2-oxoglutarate aldolase
MATPDTIARFATMDTATIHESGAPMVMDGTIRHLAGAPRLCGPALTVLCPPGDNLVIHHAVASAKPGDILVVQCCSPAYGVWGEVLSLAAMERGIAGLVLDGSIRDLAAIHALGFPVFARGTALRGTAKTGRGEIAIPIACGGAIVRPQDIVVADESGIVIVPSAEAGAIAGRAEERVRKEAALMDGLRAGRTTVELLNLNRPIER